MNDTIIGGPSTDTITISSPTFNWTSESDTGIIAQEISTINLGDINVDVYSSASTDTITFPSSYTTVSGSTMAGSITISGVDDFANVTKSEHNELMERVAKLEAALTEEAELRANHPALKNAYDEYRFLLVLAKRHTPDILTDE